MCVRSGDALGRGMLCGCGACLALGRVDASAPYADRRSEACADATPFGPAFRWALYWAPAG